jgi:hypothetical protein
MKRKLFVYVVLFVFGGCAFSAGGQMRHRPEWAQFGLVALYATIAYVFVLALLPTENEIEMQKHREQLERMFDLARSRARAAASPDDPASER